MAFGRYKSTRSFFQMERIKRLKYDANSDDEDDAESSVVENDQPIAKSFILNGNNVLRFSTIFRYNHKLLVVFTNIFKCLTDDRRLVRFIETKRSNDVPKRNWYEAKKKRIKSKINGSSF